MKLFTSWKTTAAGLVTIIGELTHLWFHRPLTETDVTAAIPILVGGLGLLFARDFNKSSEDQGIAKPTVTTTPT